MKANSIERKRMKDFKVFRAKPAAPVENRVKPVNDFLEFKNEDIEQSVPRRFEEQVKKYPDKVAVNSNNNNLTYDTLNRCANRIAQTIQKFCGGAGGGFTKEPPARRRQAALLFGHGADMIIGIMGVLKAGQVYVPLDPTYPEERLIYILKDSNVGIIITHNKYDKLAKKLTDALDNHVPVIDITGIGSDVAGENPGIPINPNDPAYILYTSGSTGQPKGVVQGHRNVLHFARVYTNALHINKEDKLTLLSSYCFDAAKMDIYGALLNGGTLYPFDLKQEESLGRLPLWLQKQSITIYHSIPTVYRYFLDMLTGDDNFKTLRFIVLGGEAVYRRDVDRYKKYFPHRCIFINGLGPTESTVTLQYFIDKETEMAKESVPVGYPAAETDVRLIDENNRQIQRFGVGEIVYKSHYLALGYVNLQEKTHGAFGPDPVTGNGRVYWSGDLGKRLRDGTIEYAGRKDFQVKIRGFRVEPAEIEGRLDQEKGIKKSVIVCRRHSQANKENYLAAFYITEDGEDVDERALIAGLKETLPDYMVPGILMRIETFPLTATGKIDRSALAAKESLQWLPGLEYAAPVDGVETALVNVWKEVLKLEQVGVTDNFFVLGGNSLKAIVLTASIHKNLHVKVSLADIFRLPTVRELAEQIRASTKEIFAAVEAVEKREYYPLSSAQKRLYFLQHVDVNNTAYNMPLVFPLGKGIEKDEIESTLHKLIGRHESLRTSFMMTNELPVQQVHDNVEFEMEFYEPVGSGQWTIDSRGEPLCSPLQTEEIIDNFIRPFDLSKAPLLRSGIIKTPDSNHTWIVDMHHIVSDGTSQAILIEDFLSLYNGKNIDPLRLQYKDFSQRQNDLITGGKMKAQEDYWLDLYKGDIPRLQLPGDFRRPEVFTFAGDIYEFKFKPEDAVKFRALVSRAGGTLYMNILAALNILFYKYTGQTDIIIGTGTAGRPHADLQRIIGMFVDTLPMRSSPHGDKSYETFLKEVISNSVKAFENQDIQFEELVEKLDVERDPSRNPLFDISMVVQNFEISISQKLLLGVQGGGFLEKSPPGRRRQKEVTAAKFDMTFVVREAGDEVYIQIEYYTAVFKEETIRSLAKHLKNIIKTVISQPSVKLKEIDIISEEEKNRVLYTFNDTAREYPKDKTIHELIEEQVEKTPDSIAIVGKMQGIVHCALTYRELKDRSGYLANLLNEKGVQPGTIVGIMVERSIEMVVGTLGILKSGGAYLPIDPDYPQERRRYMLSDSGANVLVNGECRVIDLCRGEPLCSPGVSFHHSSFIIQHSEHLAYVIYTSGSTGRPKGVAVEHRSMVNICTWQCRYYNITRMDNHSQYASFGFDGSVLEIFPCLIRGAVLHIIAEEIKLDTVQLNRYYEQRDITIGYLPTRMCEKFMELENRSLRVLLAGGDKLRVFIKRDYCLYNNYGPTEIAVVTAACLVDRQYDNIPIGRPIHNSRIYILSAGYLHLQPVGVVGELCIAGDGLSRGYLNQPELTAKKFVFFSPFTFHLSPLFKTGDLGRWLFDGNIEFLGRIDHQLKIRGYRIELGEIESRLLLHPDVREAVVLAREENNCADKYLCAYIVFNGPDEPGISKQVKEYLSRSLPNYMIPSYFKAIEKIPLTPNGKIDTKALPEPERTTGEEYALPRDRFEMKLVEIWREVLGVERIGIDDNFFDLGGHSLKAMAMIAAIHEELDVRIPVIEVFERQTIRRLSQYIKQAGESRYFRIEPAEKKEYYTLSPAQKRLYFIQQMVPGNIAYNMFMSLPVGFEIDGEKLEFVLKQMISRHGSLRTSFMMVEDEPVQLIHDKVEFEMEFYKPVDSRGELLCSPLQAEEIINNFIRPFDLSKAPLLRSGIIKTPDGNHTWIVDMHHIITDAASQDLLTREFEQLYAGAELEPLRLRYKDYSQWLSGEAQKKAVKNQEEYWLKTLAGELPVLDLPYDFPRPVIQDFAGDSIGFSPGETQVKRLQGMIKEFDVTLYMLLLSIFTVCVSKLGSREDVIVGAPIAGRRHANLQNIIGMFVNTLPMRNYPAGAKTFTNFLIEVKQNTLAAYENQDCPFEELVDKVVIERDTGRHPLFTVVFNLLTSGQYNRGIQQPVIETETRKDTAKFDLQLTAVEIGDGLIFNFEYCTKLFKPGTIQRFVHYFKKVITVAIEEPGIKLSKIEIIDEKERDRLLFVFNQTEAEYPEDKTIHQLFAEQAGNNPDSTALVGNVHLSYSELNKKSNQLAYLLKEKGVESDTIVGIMNERSVEMIICILGILKAGGAYLPIDPGYPEERIQYMLNDSGVKILVTTGDLVEKIKIVNCQLSIINCQWGTGDDVGNRLACSAKGSPGAFFHHSSFIEKPNHSEHLAYVIYTSGTTGKPKGTLIRHYNVVRLMKNSKFPFDFGGSDVWTLFHSYCFDFSVWEIWGALLYGGRLIIVPEMMAKDPQQFLELLEKEKVTVLNQTPGAFYSLSDEVLKDAPKPLCTRYVIFGGEALTPAKLNQWKENYPQTKLVNMYGITETTVHVTFKEITPREIALNRGNIGKPIPTLRTYIVDRYMKLQPCGVAGELCVAGKGVARGYLNRPELTADRFCLRRPGGLISRKPPPWTPRKSFLLKGTGKFFSPFTFHLSPLYKSGDLARWLASGELEYLGRIDHQVKIRGYRVELGEIENYLLKHEQIKEAVVNVSGKDISENHLCAYVVPRSPGAVTSAQLREHLSRQLPGYMIPAYFVHLNKLPLTPNGKLDKAALPLPQPEAAALYIEPKDEVEEKLVGIWREVLGLEGPISTHADFFELGGHSLNAVRAVNAIHKALNVKIPVQALFQSPRIAELAAIIRENEITPFVEIEKLPPQEYYELSYSQKRLWVLHKRNPDSQAFNMPKSVTFNEEVDKRVIQEVSAKLLARHESLRTCFVEVDGKIVQKIVPGAEVKLAEIDVSHLPAEEQHAQRYRLVAEESLIPFDLEKPPLLRVKLVKCSEAEYDLVFNMHHLISDGWSLEILKKEFFLFYNSMKQGNRDEPPGIEPVKIQYKEYAAWHNRLLADPGRMRGPLEFWGKQLQGTVPLLNLPYDFPPHELTEKSRKSSGFRVVVNEETTGKLRTLARQYNASLFMVLLAGMNMLLWQLRGQEDILIGMPGAARQHENLENTIGLFVNTLVLRTRVDKEEIFPVFLERLQTDALKMIEYQSYPLELICEQLKTKYPQISLFFNMVNTGDTHRLMLPGVESYHIETVQDTKFDIAFYLTEYKNGINIICNYFSQLFMPKTIEKIVRMYIRLLGKIAEVPGKKLKEYRGAAKKRKLRFASRRP